MPDLAAMIANLDKHDFAVACSTGHQAVRFTATDYGNGGPGGGHNIAVQKQFTTWTSSATQARVAGKKWAANKGRLAKIEWLPEVVVNAILTEGDWYTVPGVEISLE